ncbi:MAG TPA: transporter substrate-binding domain-containing protein [Candidatus Latescibacteria bacterium]|jgi:polar amino acid transport system substrate-binding protein|nr:transporter substrate-binding domain-containing protein [Candidatus Latescibacterota bacterium]HJP29649.1 transporter substrate-binding domain-containing protein [Candidatus Latescibacterota bacterium]
MQQQIGTAILLLIISLCSVATGQDERITVVVDQAYPPYMYGPADSTQGLYPEMIRAIFDRAGVKAEIVGLPWERALARGREGTAAIGGIYRNEERLQTLDYSDPIFEETLVLYVKKGSAFSFSGFGDLQGKVVGLNRGWSYGEDFDSIRKKGVFRTEEANDNLANFRKLIRGRIDCFIADELSASQIIHQQHLVDLVERAAQPAATNKAYVVLAKKTNKKAVLEKFNRALGAMRKDGTYERLIGEFLGKAREAEGETQPSQGS